METSTHTNDTMSISNSNMPCRPFVELKKAKTIKTSTAVMSTPAHSGSFGNSLPSAFTLSIQAPSDRIGAAHVQ